MIVLKDTREQLGWTFPEMKISTLATGDYSLEGYERLLTIERKGTSGEFARNIVQGRFENELTRMESFPYPFMILEFTMSDILNFPVNSGIPKNLWKGLKVSSLFILKRYIEFQVKYKTKIILAGKHGEDVALSIFKRIESENNAKKT